jgi:hypothetical protein
MLKKWYEIQTTSHVYELMFSLNEILLLCFRIYILTAIKIHSINHVESKAKEKHCQYFPLQMK